jgi:hypothetical protein
VALPTQLYQHENVSRTTSGAQRCTGFAVLVSLRPRDGITGSLSGPDLVRSTSWQSPDRRRYGWRPRSWSTAGLLLGPGWSGDESFTGIEVSSGCTTRGGDMSIDHCRAG